MSDTHSIPRPKPVVLAILDGFGCGHGDSHDAIHLAETPCLDALMANYPTGKINASELHVGLPDGQMGNSEVGHMNIGAGRVVMQDLPRIDQAIAVGSIPSMPAYKTLVEKALAGTKVVHMLGLISPGGVHAHHAHMIAMANYFAACGLEVHVHAFLDGRDTPPKSALEYIQELEKNLPASAYISTISGRFFAMDRDKRWDRVEQAYNALLGNAPATFKDAKTYIETEYAAGNSDEFVLPACHEHYKGMQDGDALFMVNFRADRAREILHALLDGHFDGFARTRTVKFSASLGMVEYSTALATFMTCLFQPESLSGLLGEVVANAGFQQLRIAETEKYAHVTFFFNGGREEVYAGEQRILIPSPQVKTYDLKPEMSAYEVTDALVDAIESDVFDFIVVNYANTDMVGHTGNIPAAIAAVQAVDTCLQRVVDAVLNKQGAMLITADHGNAEQMYDAVTLQAHTAHTLNLVPAILVAPYLKHKRMDGEPGKLADVAPTLLELMQLQKPAEMSGNSLMKKVQA